mmetsp:Transcript_13044/g.26448  ORF Transcript_13044/g.26448 Transcript_13044/m.26448 type:complete len:289 (+) Transcript_13044:328-1194(+)
MRCWMCILMSMCSISTVSCWASTHMIPPGAIRSRSQMGSSRDRSSPMGDPKATPGCKRRMRSGGSYRPRSRITADPAMAQPRDAAIIVPQSAMRIRSRDGCRPTHPTSSNVCGKISRDMYIVLGRDATSREYCACPRSPGTFTLPQGTPSPDKASTTMTCPSSVTISWMSHIESASYHLGLDSPTRSTHWTEGTPPKGCLASTSTLSRSFQLGTKLSGALPSSPTSTVCSRIFDRVTQPKEVVSFQVFSSSMKCRRYWWRSSFVDGRSSIFLSSCVPSWAEFSRCSNY